MINPVHNYSFMLAVAQIYPLTVTVPEVLREVSQNLATEWTLQEPDVSLENRCVARELFALNGARRFLEERGLDHMLAEHKPDSVEPSLIESVLRECYPNLSGSHYARVIQELADRILCRWHASDLSRDMKHIPWELVEEVVREVIRAT